MNCTFISLSVDINEVYYGNSVCSVFPSKYYEFRINISTEMKSATKIAFCAIVCFLYIISLWLFYIYQ